MDLFGDLPAPTVNSSKWIRACLLNNAHQLPAAAPSLFDDLPPEKTDTVSLGKREEEGNGVDKSSAPSAKRSRLQCKFVQLTTLYQMWLIPSPLANYRFSLCGYHGERRGEREDMQDAHTMIDDFTPQFQALPNDM